MSLWGEVPGQDSYSAYTTFAFVVLFAVIATHLKTSSQLWRLLGAIVVMSTLVAGYAILQHYGHDFLDLIVPARATRATSTLSNPILAGSVMLMAISMTLVGATISVRGRVSTVGFWWKLAFWGTVLAVQMLGFLFMLSRGPWVGAVVALVGLVGLVTVLRHWQLLIRAVAVLVLAGTITTLTFYLSQEQSAARSEEAGTEKVAELVGSVGGQFGAGGGLSGRMEIWQESWGLMTRHPWFEFDSLSLSFARPLVGYGPDLSHATYLLVSPPGFDRLPSEFAHAYNYFVHQGVELGFLGLVASIGLYAAVLLTGGYLLFWRNRSYSIVHTLVLIGLVTTVGGRLVEQMVGIARVSDLTIFWVLLAVFAALPSIVETQKATPNPAPQTRKRKRKPNRTHSNSLTTGHHYQWWFPGQLLLIACLVVGIRALTWLKGINYVRAAVSADSAAAQAKAGELQVALSSIDQSIDLAPDVSSYYSNQATVYAAFGRPGALSQHLKCGSLADIQAQKVCLADEAYQANLKWVENRPLSFQARFTLAGSAFQLAVLKNGAELARQSITFHRTAAQSVPTSFRAWDRLADVYIVLGQPQAALEAVEKSLAITGDHSVSASALLLQAEAYEKLGQTQQELESLDKAISVRPSYKVPYFVRGSTYRLLGQHERAVEDLSQAIDLGLRLKTPVLSR